VPNFNLKEYTSCTEACIDVQNVRMDEYIFCSMNAYSVRKVCVECMVRLNSKYVVVD
jgi:hypothetical protein